MSNKPKYNWKQPSLFSDDHFHPVNKEFKGYKIVTNKNGKTQRLAIIGRTKEDFIRKSQAVWGDQYDYSETVYTTSKSPVTIRCKKHNHYFTVPFAQNHYMKPHGNVKPTGCDLCTAEAIGYYPRNRGPHRFRTEEEKQREAEEKARRREERKQRAEQRKNEHSEREERQQEEQAYIEKWQAKNFLEARFKDRVFQMYDDKYDTSLVDYINNETEVTLICPEHGEFRIRPKILLVGVTRSNGTKLPPHGCWKCCGMIPPSEKKKPMTADEFFLKMNEIYGDRFDFSHSEFNGMNKSVVYVCKEHGEQKSRVATLLKGKGCDYCSGRLFWGPDFERRAREKHGDKYDYSKVGEIKGMKSVVTIICPKHGEFRQRVDLHLLGYGCRECVGYPNKKTPQQRCDEWIKKCIKKYGEGRYDYSRAHEDYVNNDSLVWIRCCIHDKWFQQTPDNNLRTVNGSCPICSADVVESQGEQQIRRWLEEHNIKFEKEPEIPNDNPRCKRAFLKPDFWLPDHNLYIEYNGEQHYEDVECFHTDVWTLEDQQERDRTMRRYCHDNHHNLLEIPYWDFHRIDEILTVQLLNIND